jgi:hypothetical protein
VQVAQADNVQAATPVIAHRLQLQLLDTFQLQMALHHHLMQSPLQVAAKAVSTAAVLVEMVDQVAAVLHQVVPVEHQLFQARTITETLVAHPMAQVAAVVAARDK